MGVWEWPWSEISGRKMMCTTTRSLAKTSSHRERQALCRNHHCWWSERHIKTTFAISIMLRNSKVLSFVPCRQGLALTDSRPCHSTSLATVARKVLLAQFLLCIIPACPEIFPEEQQQQQKYFKQVFLGSREKVRRGEGLGEVELGRGNSTGKQI